VELVQGLAVLGELTPRSIDAISSYGERLSSRIVALAFRQYGIESAHVDSRCLIVTDLRHTQAAPLLCQTYSRLSAVLPELARDKVVVMGGFIGASEDGVTTTLGRGGSDFTAALVGAGVQARIASRRSRSQRLRNWLASAPKYCIPPRCFRRWKRISLWSS
jgi:aspartate kinase